jgi:hypothetical protein
MMDHFEVGKLQMRVVLIYITSNTSRFDITTEFNLKITIIRSLIL